MSTDPGTCTRCGRFEERMTQVYVDSHPYTGDQTPYWLCEACEEALGAFLRAEMRYP